MDVKNYCQAHAEQGDSTFIAEFPYKDYLKQRDLFKIASFEKDKKQFIENERNGTIILQKSFDSYLADLVFDTMNLSVLKRQILLGEQHLKANQYFSDPDFLYVSFGDQLISESTKTLENRIK